MCAPLQEETAFCNSISSSTYIAVYNPIAHTRDIHVNLNVASASICAYGTDGTLMGSQTRKSPDDSSTYELSFLAEQVPALGFQTYYLKSCSSSASTTYVYSSGEVIIENDYYSLTVDASTGKTTLLYDKERNIGLPFRYSKKQLNV